MEPEIIYETLNGYTNIRNVDIAIIGKEGGDADFTDALVKRMIKNFEISKAKGHLPTVFLGHNEFTDMSEKPAIGRLDNLRIIGSKLFADIVKVKNDLLDTIKDEYPSRSIEFDPVRGVLAGMALLGSREPFYHLRQFAADGQFMLKFCDSSNKTILINTNLKSMFNLEEDNQTEETTEATEEVAEVEETESESAAEEAETVVTEEEEAEEEEETEEEESEDNVTVAKLRAELTAAKTRENELVQKLRADKIVKSVDSLMQGKKITANEAKQWKSFLKNVNEQKEEQIIKILNSRNEMKAFEELGHSEEVNVDDDDKFNEQVNAYAKENSVSKAEAAKAITSKLRK